MHDRVRRSTILHVTILRIVAHAPDAAAAVPRRAVLAKYYIGDLAVDDGRQEDSFSLEDELADGTFYAVLKKRVAAYFRTNKVGMTACAGWRQHASDRYHGSHP